MNRRAMVPFVARALVAAALAVSFAPTHGAHAAPAGPAPFATFDPSTAPDCRRSRAVARVLGHCITRDTLKALARGRDPAAAISALVWTPLATAYMAEQGLDVSPAECDEVLASVAAHEGTRPDTSEASRQMAAGIVRLWKFNRSLYQRYGGLVIFQQLDPLEPVGAYRAFLGELERRGVFEIYDPGLRRDFWRQFPTESSFEIPASRVNFDVPWWRMGAPATGATPAPAPSGPPGGYVIVGQAVRFVFDPARFESATNGTTGAWAALGSLRVRQVCVAGDFNGWSREAWVMRPVGAAGAIHVLERSFAELGAGRHEFKFVVNGEWWVEPPAGAPNRSETGLGNAGGNFVVVVPGPAN